MEFVKLKTMEVSMKNLFVLFIAVISVIGLACQGSEPWIEPLAWPYQEYYNEEQLVLALFHNYPWRGKNSLCYVRFLQGSEKPIVVLILPESVQAARNFTHSFGLAPVKPWSVGLYQREWRAGCPSPV